MADHNNYIYFSCFEHIANPVAVLFFNWKKSRFAPFIITIAEHLFISQFFSANTKNDITLLN
jgi:DNA-directed RNA polymerase specialized sigma24 family protein